MEIISALETEALPAWDNTTEYQALGSPDFQADLDRVGTLTAEIEALNQSWADQFALAQDVAGKRDAFLSAMRQISILTTEAYTLKVNLEHYINCALALDSKNALAVKLSSQVRKAGSDLEATATTLDLYLVRCDDDIFREYLLSPLTKAETFSRTEARKQKDLMLSEEQERLLVQMRQFGLTGWGELYDAISGSMRVNTPSHGEVGLAQAAILLRNSDENVRREAYRAIQAAWKVYEEPVAAILNNLAGFRLEEYRQRSTKRTIDFLEYPLMDSRIERATLDAMFRAIEEEKAIVARALQVVAKCFGRSRMEPWNFLAPAPGRNKNSNAKFNYATAIRLVTEAFGGVDPAMGEFVTMMLKNRWIDSRVLPNKRTGAFCTGFPKSRTSRVFQTFVGSYKETSTLAHELGHAWHSWVMRDLPLPEVRYPMTLAETASIFAETALAEHVFASGDQDTRFEIAFSEVSHAIVLLANIPTRFEFEKNFYTARAKGTLTPAELNDLTDKAFRKYYGDALTETESQFWMTKLHFSIPEVSFYNYPYTFGYLFSLGIYAQRESAANSAEFAARYKDILRDTGRMTAEALIQKHLGSDIRQPDFWRQSLKVVESKVAALEKLMAN